MAVVIVLCASTSTGMAALIDYRQGADNPFVADYSGVEDTLLRSDAPHHHYGAAGSLQLVGGDGGASRLGRSLIRFDLSSMQGRYQSINSATLTFYQSDAPSTEGGFTFSAYDIADANADWVAGPSAAGSSAHGYASWNWKRTQQTAWAGSDGLSIAGVDYETAAVASGIAVDPTNAQYTKTVINLPGSLVLDWAAGDNAGLLLALDDEASSTANYAFASSEHVAGVRPILTIDYTPLGGARRADFGQQWVRQNPYSLMGAARGRTPSFDPQQYQDAGLNAVFSNNDLGVAEAAAQANLPLHVHTYFGASGPNVGNAGHQDYFHQYAALADRGGLLFWDEPGQHDMVQAAEAAQWLREYYPDTLIYVNAFPMFVYGDGSGTGGYSYDDYLDDIVHVVKSDVLMFDMYPFSNTGTTDRHGWMNNLMAVRNKALANDLPYWAFLQSLDVSYLRTPSESDTRYNAFTLLTAGYTGLSYFSYDNQDNSITGTFFDQNGEPTPFYHDAAASNAEIANLGKVMRFLTSTEVNVVPGSSPSVPSSLTNWTFGAGGDENILSITLDTSDPANQGAGKDGLVGFFTGDDDEQYFMLTNLYHSAGLDADDAILTFIIEFDESVNSVWRMNRLTGLAEEMILDSHVLHLTLPGGTGDLFKYDDGNFIPEPTSGALLSLGWLLMRRRPSRAPVRPRANPEAS